MTLWLSPPRPSLRTSLTRPMSLPTRGSGSMESRSCRDTVVGWGWCTAGGNEIGAPFETDPANGGRRIAVGRHHRRIAVETAVLVTWTPVEPAASDLVYERQEEDHREDDDRPEPELAHRGTRDRVRVEEHDLDVEHDEQHRDDVEAHRESVGWLAAGHDAALVRRFLGVGRTARSEDARGDEGQRAEHDGERHQHHDRKVLTHVSRRRAPCDSDWRRRSGHAGGACRRDPG